MELGELMSLSCFLQTSFHIPQENKHDIDIHLQNPLAKEPLAELFNFHNLIHIYTKLSQFIIVVNNIKSTIENNMAKYKTLRYPKIGISSIGMIVY